MSMPLDVNVLYASSGVLTIAIVYKIPSVYSFFMNSSPEKASPPTTGMSIFSSLICFAALIPLAG